MNKKALVAVLILVAGMMVLRHYWADFRHGMDYPFQHNGECQ